MANRNVRGSARWALLFLAPQTVGLLLFSAGPLVYMLVLGFLKWNGYGSKVFAGVSNYIGDITDPQFLTALVNTFYFILLTVPTGIVFAVIAATLVNTARFKTIYRTLYFMPVITNSVAVGIVWMWLLNGKFGLINAALKTLGIAGPQWLTNTSLVMPSIGIVSVWWGLGFSMVLFLAGLQAIPGVYYEAAEIDGATPLQRFFRITLPLLSPTTLFVTVITIINSFQVFDQSYVITNGGPAFASYTLVFHIYDTAFKSLKFGQSASVSTILFLMILLFTAIQMRLSRSWVHYGS